MRNATCLLAIICTSSVICHAQSGPAGTWRVEGAKAPFPWEVVLRTDGSQLTGMVSNCASGAVDISDAYVDRDTVRFTCASGGDNDRVITFVGKVNGDEMTLSWSLRVRDGGVPPNASNAILFGPSAPRQVTARRVAGGRLAAQADNARGVELAAAVNLRDKNVKAEGRLFLPVKIARVRALIVAIDWGLGASFYEDLQVRKLLESAGAGLLLARFSDIGPATLARATRSADSGGAESLSALLERLAAESGHSELTALPLLFWGHSSAGNAGTYFALTHPDRTIAFVLYHSAAGGAQAPKLPLHTPGLIFKGAKDTTGPPYPEDFWKRGRAAGAPWTFIVERKPST